MKHITDLHNIPEEARGAVLALGNFDGVHLGHQQVIRRAQAIARESGRPAGVVTFEPHPRAFFQPDTPPFRLMNAETRANRLARMGLDLLFELPFDAQLAAMEPEAFVEEVLARGLGAGHVVVGEDFRFGRGRRGDVDSLARLGERLGFGVTAVPLLKLGQGEVSSTAIRRALSEGRPEEAARMLGHLHRIDGPVEHGDKRGRALGFPTANLSLAGLHLPRFGVYAVRAEVLTGPHRGSHGGVASIGTRPVFGGVEPKLEVHLFDFDGDLYGEHLSVGLERFLRPEENFESVEALVRQMHEDARQARAVLQEPRS